MKKIYIIFLILILGVFFAYKMLLPEFNAQKQILEEDIPLLDEVKPEELTVTIWPRTILQGDPAMVQISGVSTTTVERLTFNDKPLEVFTHSGKPTALIGMDLRMSPGTYPIKVTLGDGTILSENLVVTPRKVVQEPLGIPEKLGGNTPESERELVNTLVQEGAIISAVPSKPEKLWEGSFRAPIDEPIYITDTYGYSRITGASSISHKGTDYRASVGTPVFAMNSGEVGFNQYLRNYGNTVIIDHGYGLHTIYMHLSESLVTLGQKVKKGQMIARSGDSGYTLGPHLHLTVRINSISIDPERFMALFVD